VWWGLQRWGTPLCTGSVLLLLAACGSDSGGSAGPSASGGPSAALSRSATLREVAERDALAAYTGLWMTMAKDAETSDAEDLELRGYASGNALALVVNSLAVDKMNGVISRGRPVLHPRVVSRNPDAAPAEAAIEDCMDSTQWTKAKADSSAYHDPPGGKRKIAATLRSTDGTWKVVEFDVGEVGSC
jgi:hypothetical protein